MSPWIWVGIAVAVIVVAAVVLLAVRSARSRRLQQQFGPEYDRTVSDAPNRREAESMLAEREKRRKELEIRPLAPAARDRYAEEWLAVQSRFVDDPAGAVGDADALVQRVMGERGYPISDFDSQADLISVDHPVVVENYRSAHAIHESFGRGDAGTEDLRQAMVHYRALFEELLETGGRVTTGTEER
ncbi:MAG TPA: hypothetical protein VIU44_07605 [Gaiellaceae bacterium]